MSCEVKHYSFPSPWSMFPTGKEFSLYPKEGKKEVNMCFYDLESGPLWTLGGVAA